MALSPQAAKTKHVQQLVVDLVKKYNASPGSADASNYLSYENQFLKKVIDWLYQELKPICGQGSAQPPWDEKVLYLYENFTALAGDQNPQKVLELAKQNEMLRKEVQHQDEKIQALEAEVKDLRAGKGEDVKLRQVQEMTEKMKRFVEVVASSWKEVEEAKEGSSLLDNN